MPARVHPYATMGTYGDLRTDARRYRPLDTVTVTVTGRAQGDDRCTLRVCDDRQRPYFQTEVSLKDNRGQAQFLAGGPLGNHYLYLLWPGEKRHSRYLNFQVDCEAGIETGDADLDWLYPFTRDAMRCLRRQYDTPRGRFVGYMSADTWHFDGIWLRDWVYQAPAYRWWERDVTCGLDRFLEAQTADGMLADGIERDGRTWRVGLESDVEYIMTLAVWHAWQMKGDNAWLAAALPRLERALQYICTDAKHWDAQHELVKRQHSCDTWDYDIDGASDRGEGRYVVAACDQSGYAQAFAAMGAMWSALGDGGRAAEWAGRAEDYRRRAVALLWDGGKFQHHAHLDAIDHGDFDETSQLAMGNTWAMTRGLADGEQSRSIIDEYRRRHAATGDAYPWWSLQPGYPDHLKYWTESYRLQGAYANGGLMPWVGGELCRAAMQNGREGYGVELMRQYIEHLRRTGGAHVWYWPDGTPGFRTTNEVPYAGWGMAEWINALFEGLGGVKDCSCLMGRVSVSPRWFAAGVDAACVRARYAASDGYFAYRLRREGSNLIIAFSGSGQHAEFSVLLPRGRQATAVTVNGAAVSFSMRHTDGGAYVEFNAPICGASQAEIGCSPS